MSASALFKLHTLWHFVGEKS